MSSSEVYRRKWLQSEAVLSRYDHALKTMKKWLTPFKDAHPFKAMYRVCLDALDPETFPDNFPEKPFKLRRYNKDLKHKKNNK